MSIGYSPRTPFTVLSAVLFLSFVHVSSAFAGADLSSTSSLSSNIITVGFAGLAALTLYAVFLVFNFLKKALKESSQAAKEAAANHPHAASSSLGETLFSIVNWVCGAFGILSVGALLVVSFFLLSENELSSTKSISRLIITIGLGAAALLFLYILFLTLAFLWRVFRGPQEAALEPVLSVSPASGELAAAGLPVNPEFTRRSFLSLLGWAWVAFTAASLGAVSTILRFFFPNVTFEPPLKFKVGFPEQFAVGVDNRFKDDHRVWIVRTETGFYALSTVCTHLGCTPNWLSVEQKFKCPCHGSGFYITGINFEGPAPRPLERFKIAFSDDGQIEVDESEKFQYEKGEWAKAGAFLTYKV
jgi:cytochrome b6-f complex iron-sulfur subunit